jgi:hypothetical protein
MEVAVQWVRLGCLSPVPAGIGAKALNENWESFLPSPETQNVTSPASTIEPASGAQKDPK